MLLSTKDLKYQMKGRRLEKLMERFVGLYQVKGIISANAIELDLPTTVKIHPVVNVSRVRRYKDQVEGQNEEEYSENIGQSRRTVEEEKRGELLGRYMVKMLYSWNDKKFDQEYWGRLERNWQR